MKAFLDGHWIEIKERRIRRDLIVEIWRVWRLPITYALAIGLGAFLMWGVAK